MRRVWSALITIAVALAEPVWETRAVDAAEKSPPGAKPSADAAASPADSVVARSDSVAAPADSVAAPADGPLAPADTAGAAAPDTLVIDVPSTYQPSAPRSKPALRPCPAVRADSLQGVSLVDAFLMPPQGPALFFDRTDLRLTGPAEWWEVMGGLPGVFALPPGYPGAVTPVSFHAHGPEGTLMAFGGRALTGGLAPVENPNPIGKGALTGAAVMRAAASHLYGPGAGGGAILFVPLVQAPDRPYTELTHMTGIFGQRGGSVTTATRWGRLGFLLDYAGSAANTWSLFHGYEAERASGRLDWVQGPWRVSLSGRTRDEHLRAFLLPDGRIDRGREGEFSLERRMGRGWFTSLRLTEHRSTVIATGERGDTERTLWRRGGEALLYRPLGGSFGGGVLIGHYLDRVDRYGLGRGFCRLEETSSFVVLRGQSRFRGIRADASIRYDRLVTGRSTLAPGITLSREIGRGSMAWVHVARTLDRAAYFHRITDYYTQLDQGIDLPRPKSQPILEGVAGSTGLTLWQRGFRGDVAVVAEGYGRITGTTPAASGRPLSCDEPEKLSWRVVHSAGGWGAVEVGPIDFGRIIGRILLGGSGYYGSTPERRRLQVEPWRYAEVHGRLSKTLFGGHLRLEGSVRGEFVGEMQTPLGDLAPQTQWIGRIDAQFLNMLLFYRVENIFSKRFLSSAWNPDLRYVPTTRQNILFGLSWVLLD